MADQPKQNLSLNSKNQVILTFTSAGTTAELGCCKAVWTISIR